MIGALSAEAISDGRRAVMAGGAGGPNLAAVQRAMLRPRVTGALRPRRQHTAM
jgi:hypothetical protein